MVKILAVADEESDRLIAGQVRRIAPDLVLAAGDLRWSYLEFIASCVDAPLLFVPGNHDPQVMPTYEHRCGMHFQAGMPALDPRPHGGINVDCRVVDVAGLRVAGLGGCVRYRPGPNQYTQREYQKRAAHVARAVRRHAKKKGGPATVDILLTHAPPRHCGDEEDPPHHGIEALHPLMEHMQPQLVVHGHIHPFGQRRPDRQIERTIIRNVVPFKVFDLPTAEQLAGDAP